VIAPRVPVFFGHAATSVAWLTSLLKAIPVFCLDAVLARAITAWTINQPGRLLQALNVAFEPVNVVFANTNREGPIELAALATIV
jgi:hypothetical protein